MADLAENFFLIAAPIAILLPLGIAVHEVYRWRGGPRG